MSTWACSCTHPSTVTHQRTAHATLSSKGFAKGTGPRPGAQVRWGALLAKLLRTYRTRITLSIPWRPLFETLRAKFVEGLDTYSGALLRRHGP